MAFSTCGVAATLLDLAAVRSAAFAARPAAFAASLLAFAVIPAAFAVIPAVCAVSPPVFAVMPGGFDATSPLRGAFAGEALAPSLLLPDSADATSAAAEAAGAAKAW
jgi:hypothetical protein